MEEFKFNFESLTNKLGNDYNLSEVLDFCTYFRCDDISLFNEYKTGIKDSYMYDGYYPTDTLINLYCKKNNITLNDDNASIIFSGLLDNIWNNNMSYHITTSVSAKNIAEFGMDPEKKGIEEMNDVIDAMNSLSLEKRNLFFPYFLGDKDYYSYSSIPKFSNNYGRTPEWFLNLTGYKPNNLDESLNYVISNMSGESDIAKEKMYNLVSKYYDVYKDSTRTLVVIPNLNKKINADSLMVDNVAKLKRNVNYFLSARRNNIDGKTNQVIPNSELMFIDLKSKKAINLNDQTKKI